MENELAQLRERVGELERRCGDLQKQADEADARVGAINSLEDAFVMPALLLLGGDVLRERMLRWLEYLVADQRDNVEVEGVGKTELDRLVYWQDLLRKREPWPRFPPDGWMSPREEPDG